MRAVHTDPSYAVMYNRTTLATKSPQLVLAGFFRFFTAEGLSRIDSC